MDENKCAPTPFASRTSPSAQRPHQLRPEAVPWYPREALSGGMPWAHPSMADEFPSNPNASAVPRQLSRSNEPTPPSVVISAGSTEREIQGVLCRQFDDENQLYHERIQQDEAYLEAERRLADAHHVAEVAEEFDDLEDDYAVYEEAAAAAGASGEPEYLDWGPEAWLERGEMGSYGALDSGDSLTSEQREWIEEQIRAKPNPPDFFWD